MVTESAGLLESVRGTTRHLLAPVRGNVRRILTAGFTTAAIALGLSFLVEPRYESSLSFYVDHASARQGLPVGLAGLGQALGVSTDDITGQPLQFYAWLATSEPVLHQALLDTVPSPLRRDTSDPADATLGRQYCAHWFYLCLRSSYDDSVAVRKAVDKLSDFVSADVDLETSLVTITAAAPSRELATWLARRLFTLVNVANTNSRQGRASNEVAFLQRSVAAARDKLTSAEDDLRSFYDANRQFQSSPRLVFEEARLQRAVSGNEDAFLALDRALRDAELRAVKDVPALSLIEGPLLPIKKASPKRALITLLAFLLGMAYAYGQRWALIHTETPSPD